METQKQRRQRIKAETKERMKINNTSPYVAALIYYGIVIGVIFAISILISIPIIFLAISQGTSRGMDTGSFTILTIVINYVAQVISGVVMSFLTIGFMRYNLKISRYEATKYSDIFSGFTKKGAKAFVATFLAMVLSNIVALIFSPLILAAFLIGIGSPIGIILYLIAMIGIVVVCYIVTLCFIFTVYLIHDYDNMGIINALKTSYKIMKGHKWEMFKVQMSFCGWVLLCVISLGFVGIYFIPYNLGVIASYYNELSSEV